MKLLYSDIERILEKAVECAEYYEREYLNNKVFTLYLSNGEKVKYTISPANVPHLLGINIYALKGIINLRNDGLLPMFKELNERAYELSNKFKVGLLKQEDVFSDFVWEKLDNFKSNINSDIQNILSETQFVCCYESEKSWNVTKENRQYDYIVIKKLTNGKMAMLGIVRNGNRCYAMSSQVFETAEKAKNKLTKLLTNQDITLLTGMEVFNTYNESKYSKSLFPSEQLNKLHEMKKYRDEFKSHIDLTSQCEYALGRLGDNREEKFETKSIIEDIVNAIIKQKLIPAQEYEDSILKSIINAWNDHICKNNGKTNNKVAISYTTAITELTKFKGLVLSLEEENRRLQGEINNLTTENSQLKLENDEQKETIDKVYEIIKPRIN